jgi:hypothetical protein
MCLFSKDHSAIVLFASAIPLFVCDWKSGGPLILPPKTTNPGKEVVLQLLAAL